MPFKDNVEKAKYMRKYRLDRRARGLCVICGEKRISEWFCVKHLAKGNEKSKQQNIDSRLECINHYGAFCVCCGEKEDKFLSIDHVNNDGFIHRKTTKNFRNIYLWLKKNNYPNIVQVLCFNCNLGKRVNGGICPHLKA